MNETLVTALGELEGRLEQKLAEVKELKTAINALCRQVGQQARYQEADEVRGPVPIGPAEFFGLSPLKAAKRYLELIDEVRTPEQIVAALEGGGFDFDAHGWNTKKRLRALAVTLGKNPKTFTKIPGGYYGLASKFPGAKKGGMKESSGTNGNGVEPRKNGSEEVETTE